MTTISRNYCDAALILHISVLYNTFQIISGTLLTRWIRTLHKTAVKKVVKQLICIIFSIISQHVFLLLEKNQSSSLDHYDDIYFVFSFNNCLTSHTSFQIPLNSWRTFQINNICGKQNALKTLHNCNQNVLNRPCKKKRCKSKSCKKGTV